MNDLLLRSSPLGAPPWPTLDPFLFCVYHKDDYPPGDAQLGPRASLDGRRIGHDFEGKDGWRMYHGDRVPGFPRHPHRGFETITVTRRGYIDHSDSLDATARFGGGDVQWMTAGEGIVHCEMFPLLEQERRNPSEFFQLWLNLPSSKKLAPPHFKLFWREELPQHQLHDAAGRPLQIVTVAGQLGDETPPAPPPNSWAAERESELALWTIELSAHAHWTLPAASPGLNRCLYLFEGAVEVAGQKTQAPRLLQLRSERTAPLVAGSSGAQLLLLQGRPIGEPVAQYGPFVMNTEAELRTTFADYRRTQFGGWRWGSNDPVHPREAGRFARYPSGEIFSPPAQGRKGAGRSRP